MIEVGKKYGCLTVLDDGTEYSHSEKMAASSEIETHYKCQCKCGRIHYYNQSTLETNPRYCFYPIPISTKFTYSVRAANATYNKRKKYEGIECVVLQDKSKCLPSDKYCERYNEYKLKQLDKNEEKLRLEVAKIPRVYAENYDIDFVGRVYESLLIEECCNDHLESTPTFDYSQQHRKCWRKITVYKQYKCRCLLCGKVQLINCDKFGIYPPTAYGYRAYNGYWSDVSCDCHTISSFQWIVNKLLFENRIPYQAEYSFPDLLGTQGVNNLRFDFAVMNEDGSIKYLIECQGEQHFMPVEEFGGASQHIIQVKNDERKRAYAQKNKIPLLEISYKHKKYEKVEEILKKHQII